MIGLDRSWLLLVASNVDSYQSIQQDLESREREFLLSTELESKAYADLQKKSCLVALHRDIQLTSFRGTQCRLDFSTIDEDWISLRALGNFVSDYSAEPAGGSLVIIIDDHDLEAYRLACFVTAYCLERKTRTRIIGLDNHEIEPLYGPPINVTTKKCLFSVVDYLLRHGASPDFPRLRDHHFGNLSLLEISDVERSRRIWSGKEDNRYVAALYATLRTLENDYLIRKPLDASGKRISSIEPTWNGILSVIFSSLFPLFSQTLGGVDAHEDES